MTIADLTLLIILIISVLILIINFCRECYKNNYCFYVPKDRIAYLKRNNIIIPQLYLPKTSCYHKKFNDDVFYIKTKVNTRNNFGYSRLSTKDGREVFVLAHLRYKLDISNIFHLIRKYGNVNNIIREYYYGILESEVRKYSYNELLDFDKKQDILAKIVDKLGKKLEQKEIICNYIEDDDLVIQGVRR